MPIEIPACEFDVQNSMTVQQLSTGWLPATLALMSRPPEATWLEFGPMRLLEPFFEDSVRKLRLGFPPPRELTSDLNTVLEVGSKLPQVTPQGLIFHISRCGSTLLANALRASPGILVVSEAAPITNVLSPYGEWLSPCTPDEWAHQQKKLLQSLANVFGHYRAGHEERVIIKFASWNILSWNVVRSLWPDVPCVVLIRDPVEVMISNLTISTGWMKNKAYPLQAEDKTAAEMEETEYCARIIGKFCEAGAELEGRNCRVLDYEHLNVATFRDAAAFLGVELREDRVQQVLKIDAKDPRQRRPFQRDGAKKQHAATESMRKAAQTWSIDAYSRLRKHTSW
jgi:hypothetical protein